jgi:hypothetical protein
MAQLSLVDTPGAAEKLLVRGESLGVRRGDFLSFSGWLSTVLMLLRCLVVCVCGEKYVLRKYVV